MPIDKGIQLKTSEAWQKEYADEFTVLDPDGWDRSPQGYHHSWYGEKITRQQFMQRVIRSTCEFYKPLTKKAKEKLYDSIFKEFPDCTNMTRHWRAADANLSIFKELVESVENPIPCKVINNGGRCMHYTVDLGNGNRACSRYNSLWDCKDYKCWDDGCKVFRQALLKKLEG